MFDLNPNFLNKLPPEDVVRGEQRKLGQINTKFRKTYLILFKKCSSICMCIFSHRCMYFNFFYNRIIILLLFCENNRIIHFIILWKKFIFLELIFFRRVDTSLVALFRFVIFFCYGNLKSHPLKKFRQVLNESFGIKSLSWKKKINTFYWELSIRITFIWLFFYY